MSLMDKLRQLFGGQPKGPAERAGEKIDRAAEKAAAQAGTVIEKAGKRLSEAGKKLKAPDDRPPAS